MRLCIRAWSMTPGGIPFLARRYACPDVDLFEYFQLSRRELGQAKAEQQDTKKALGHRTQHPTKRLV